MKVSVAFNHGLGDLAHYLSMLPLWIRRGYEIEVECRPAFRSLPPLAGATVVEKAEKRHNWVHGLVTPIAPVWAGNKVAGNLRTDPMPDIGGPEELWDELLAVQLRIPANPSCYDQTGRPLVVCHFKGDSGVLNKNYPDWSVHRFLKKLLGSKVMVSGEVILLGRSTRFGFAIVDHRVTKMRIEGIDELANLLSAANLIVGIDSGVLHFARLTDTPALGVWTEHAPWLFSLPREKTRHLSQVPGESFRMAAFNTEIWTDEDTHPEKLAQMALEMLS